MPVYNTSMCFQLQYQAFFGFANKSSLKCLIYIVIYQVYGTNAYSSLFNFFIILLPFLFKYF